MRYNKMRLARWLTLSGFFALMAGIYLWHLVLNKTEAHMISLIILVQIGPLLFPVRGLLNGKVYTHAWSMYLAIFYFVVGVWYASNQESALFGYYVVFTSLVFFTGCLMYTRFMGKQQD